MNGPRLFVGCLILACGALTGCESNLSVDLSATAPADPAVAQVLVDLLGVEFQKDDGGTARLEFNDPLPVNLANLAGGEALRLFTDEQLGDGHYTGARLIFDSSDDSEPTVTLLNGSQFDLSIGTSQFSSIDFTVSQDDSTNDRIVLTLDLRQSLVFDDNTDVYTLSALSRAVRAEDTGQLTGVVTANCQFGDLLQGGAMYVFADASVEPDDYDGTAPEPYLTTSVEFVGGITVPPTYVFQFLPEGNYTLALTCSGDRENGSAGDDVRFQNAVNVTVEAEQQTTRNIQ